MRNRIVAVTLATTAVAVLTVGGVSSPVHAATVGSGACLSTVDVATGVTATLDSAGACVVVFATAPTTPTTSQQFTTRSWTVPAGISSVDVFVVAGGGGGGMSNGSTPTGGGGGGGGIVLATGFAVTPSATVTVKTGYGGQGGNCSPGSPGGNSSFGALVAAGGGFGGGCGPAYGGPGGSAGGAHWGQPQGFAGQPTLGTPSNGTNITAYGGNGGKSYPHGVAGDAVSAGGGGGGGATTNGGDATQPGANSSSGVGGNGGEGLTNNWRTGSNQVYGSGGGGQARATQGVGGTNGGTASGTNAAGGAGIDAVDETGAGGGGGYRQGGGRSGDGGSGVVIVRYFADSTPANTAVPTVSGTVRNGEILTGTQGTWTGYPTPSYTFKWRRASTASGTYSDIAGATSATYTLTDNDVGKYLKFEVTATNASGAASQASAATVQVADFPDGTVPTLSSATSTTDGFTFTITNYSAGTTYTFLATSGSASRSGSSVTVTGVSAGQSSTITVRAAVSGFQTMSATVTGSALAAAVTTTVPPALDIVVVAPTTTSTTVVAAASPTTVPAAVLTPTTVPAAVLTPAKSSSTATTVATASTTTTLPSAAPTTTVQPAPSVPQISAGGAAVRVDGADETPSVERINNQVVVSAGPISATVGSIAEDDSVVPLDDSGTVRLKEGDRIRVRVAGFLPGSEVEAWLFSSPSKLGTALVADDGTVTATFIIPEKVPVGAHRLAIVARTADDKPAVLALGIMVGEFDPEGVSTWVIATPIVLAVLLAIFIPTTLRRRRRATTPA